jgi:hypothetical protein
MPKYVLRLTHPPDQCPTANAKTRKILVEGASAIPELAEKLKIKFLAGPLILGTEHDGIAVVEADSVETVQEFILQSGLVQWNSVRVSSARTLPEAIEEMKRVPPPLYS